MNEYTKQKDNNHNLLEEKIKQFQVNLIIEIYSKENRII